MRLIWTARAIEDLAEIRAFISRDNPSAAATIAARVSHAVARLVEHPSLGRVGREPGTRELVISRTRYIVPYRIDESSIVLLAVVHGARRWPRYDDQQWNPAAHGSCKVAEVPVPDFRA